MTCLSDIGMFTKKKHVYITHCLNIKAHYHLDALDINKRPVLNSIVLCNGMTCQVGNCILEAVDILGPFRIESTSVNLCLCHVSDPQGAAVVKPHFMHMASQCPVGWPLGLSPRPTSTTQVTPGDSAIQTQVID